MVDKNTTELQLPARNLKPIVDYDYVDTSIDNTPSVSGQNRSSVRKAFESVCAQLRSQIKALVKSGSNRTVADVFTQVGVRLCVPAHVYVCAPRVPCVRACLRVRA